jgi:integrase
MPRKSELVRVERGLYRAANVYVACATPPGSRTARWKTLGGVGLMEARRLRDEFAVDIGRRKAAASAGGRVRFAEAADDWLRSQRQLVGVGCLRPRTLEAYETATRLHLKPYFGALQMRAIGPDQLVQWHAEQRALGASAWSIKGRWGTLRLILAHAARHGIIGANPCDLLGRRERPKAGDARKRFLTDDEMRQLLSATSGRYQVLVALGLFAGLRLSEALGLIWREIDFSAGAIHVRHQLDRAGRRVELKTGRGRRDVTLMDSLGRMLREHKLASRHSANADPVLGTANQTPLSQRNATRALDRATKSAGLGDVTLHALRHTFASMLIAQGRDVIFVADQLGHSDPSITLRVYGHLFRAAREMRDARAQLDSDYGHLLRATGRSEES